MDIIDRLNKLLTDTTAHATGAVDMSQGPYGSNIMGMRYIKKKKKVKGGAEYPVHENKDRVVHRTNAWFIEDQNGSVIGGPYKTEAQAKKEMKEMNEGVFSVHEAAGKNKIISGAKNVAEEIMDDLPYKAKEYFAGWPEDVVGRDMAKVFYNNLYKHLGKLIREQIKK